MSADSREREIDRRRQRAAATVAGVIDTLRPEQVKQLRDFVSSLLPEQIDRMVPIFAAGLPAMNLALIPETLAALIDAFAMIDNRAATPKN